MDPADVTKLLDELNELEQRYGRVIAERNPNFVVSGEVRARVELLKQELADFGVEVEWDGRQYQIVGPEGP
jgi:hypothetical protein